MSPPSIFGAEACSSSGALMRAPVEINDGQNEGAAARTEIRVNRAKPAAPAASDSADRFLHKESQRDFNRQYFHLYSKRLEAMRSGPLDDAAIRRKVSSDVPIVSLSQLTNASKDDDDKEQGEEAAESREEDHGEAQEVVIVGTIFKNQALKPNILKELSDDLGLPPQPRAPKYVSLDDNLILEDHAQRIRLRGQVDVAHLVTGVVAAFRGSERESGKFHVLETILPAQPLQPERPLLTEDRYVVFASGLELADKTSAGVLRLNAALEWICGLTGEMVEQEGVIGRLERVVLAGNALGESTRDKEKANKASYLSRDNEVASAEAVTILDDFLLTLASQVEVDLMPG